MPGARAGRRICAADMRDQLAFGQAFHGIVELVPSVPPPAPTLRPGCGGRRPLSEALAPALLGAVVKDEHDV
jgi:hypothetical protein